MKEITVRYKLYDYEELSEKAKENAFMNWLESQGGWYSEGTSDDFRQVLSAFENVFDVNVKYSIDNYGYDFEIDYDWCDGWRPCGTADFTKHKDKGFRFARWAWNNLAPYIRKGKYYGKLILRENGEYNHKKRYSKCKEFDDMCLTGTYPDSFILAPLIKCLTYKEFYISFDELMRACLDRFFRAWMKELEFIGNKEYFIENYANELFYKEDGTIWEG